jgi:transcriptional regulator with XRE-family HTH domain
MGNHPNRTKINDWPEFLRAFRAGHGLTQKELADKLQISARNVENWELGFSKPPAYLKRALLDLEQFL